ncbi:MAG: DUF4097 family beta strand repeat-containing protein [Gemmatimonadota bacterium]
MMFTLAAAIACSLSPRLAVTRGSTVEIVARVADVSVIAGSRDAIELDGGTADCRRLGNVVLLEASGETTRLVVRVPSWMSVKVNASRGDVQVDDVLAPLDVDALAGDVRIRGGRDRVVVKTASGGVEVAGATGQIDISAQHRPVLLTGISGAIQLVNVNGVTTMRDIRATRLTAVTVTGEITCECTPTGEAAEWEMRASSGAVRLSLPAGVAAVATLDAPRHAATVRYPGAELQTVGSRQIVAVLGKGGARIRLTSFSGAVSLYQR